MKKIFWGFALSLLFVSCTRHTLSDTDLVWQPYQAGDRLIFVSGTGELDTVTIDSIMVVSNPDDPLSIGADRNQTIFVLLEDRRPSTIIELEANKHGKYIDFNLQLGDGHAFKYPKVRLKWEEIQLPQSHFDRYKNILKIKAEEYYDNLKDRPFDLAYIYWSMEYGYVGLEFKDGDVWALQSFFRDGKELLP